MTQITIHGIKHSTTNREGQPFLDQNGKAKTRVTITADGIPNGKREMSTFVYDQSPVLKWAVGESHEVDITFSADGKYANFFPTKKEIFPNPEVPARLEYAPLGPKEGPPGEAKYSSFTEKDRQTLESIASGIDKLVKYTTGG